jgi:anti-anti-sigma regulatory factor
MKLKSNGSNQLTISGNIKSVDDSMEIKKALSALQQHGAKSIVVTLEDSFSMTSTVIGHLMKLVNLDKIAVSLVVGDPRLYQLFEDLNLVQAFNVRQAGK